MSGVKVGVARTFANYHDASVYIILRTLKVVPPGCIAQQQLSL
jgi:hypothetical protein